MAVVALWLASGIYRVQPDEQGVVLRFGAYQPLTQPGLHWHIPWPVENVLLPAVTRINRTEIGYRSGAAGDRVAGGQSGGRDMPDESLMLTGDENIIDINFDGVLEDQAERRPTTCSTPATRTTWCRRWRKARSAR